MLASPLSRWFSLKCYLICIKNKHRVGANIKNPNRRHRLSQKNQQSNQMVSLAGSKRNFNEKTPIFNLQKPKSHTSLQAYLSFPFPYSKHFRYVSLLKTFDQSSITDHLIHHKDHFCFELRICIDHSLFNNTGHHI